MRVHQVAGAARVHRAARHALARDRFEKPPLPEGDDARHRYEGEEEGHADDQDGETRDRDRPTTTNVK